MGDAGITVEVHAQRQGKWWVLHMDDGSTQARSLGDVEEMVADYVSLMRDIPVHAVRVDLISIDPGFGLAAQVQEAKRARDEADRAQRVAARTMRETAKALKEVGLAGREVARVLGVSPQRVSQLIGAKSGGVVESPVAETVAAELHEVEADPAAK